MAIVRLWAVLGAGGVRKSTTVGHLAGDFGPGPTGLRRGRGGGLREVPLRGGGYLTIHPRRQSLQEAGKTPEKSVGIITSQVARIDNQKAIRSAHFNVLLALRTDQTKNLPPAEDYLSHFLTRGWQIVSLALLSPTKRDERTYHLFGAPICYVYESRYIDVLQVIGQVRNHFDWA